MTASATGTGGAAASSSSAGTTAAATTSSSGAGGGGVCSCAQPTVIDVDVADFEKLPVGVMYPTYIATLAIPGRTAASLLGTTAFGVLAQPATDPLGGAGTVPYVSVKVQYRNDTVIVYAGEAAMANQAPPTYKSIRFIVPAAQ